MTEKPLLDQSAACLAASLIAKSDKIQTTRFMIELWDNLRKNINLTSRLDYLAILLTQGRLMDLRVKDNDYVRLVIDNINSIKNELIIALTYPILGEKEGSPILANAYIVRLNDIASAMLAAAYTRHSPRVESSKEIIEIWSKIRDMNIVNDNDDYLIAMLGTSRVNDLRKELEHPNSLKEIINAFREIFNSTEAGIKVNKHDLAAAYMAIAVVTQTPEIESHQEILEIWKKLRTELKQTDEDLDITVAILTGGLIINRTIKLDIEDIKDIFSRVGSKLYEMNE